MPVPTSILNKRLELFPLSSQVIEASEGKHLSIGGCDLFGLAEEYGTPLYLYDSTTLDVAVDEYNQSLRSNFPGSSAITYAGKAYLCTALVQWSQRHDLWIDCTGSGEIAFAVAGGSSKERILVHGVNKSEIDLSSAVTHAGTLVVDNLLELDRLTSLFPASQTTFPDLWIRLRPGLAVQTHSYTQTGQMDSKFGMDFFEAAFAVETCLEHHLPLTGLHFHLGSQFHDPTPIAPVLSQLLDFIEEMRSRNGWAPDYICPGGGWGVAYNEDQLPHPSVDAYIKFISEHLIRGFSERNLPLPHLQVEPGRSLIARAGVALYRVGAVKQTANRRWLLLDGGMADNIRPSLYGVRYSALPVRAPERPCIIPTWLGGPYCESGDVLIENLLLPEVQPGELIAIPVSGAYHLSMSSNYNGALKPAVLWLEKSKASLIQRRQVTTDLLARDLSLPT